jgi:hypothetical protein
MPAAIRLDAPPANDNAVVAPGKPEVSVPGGRAEATYACAGNLILPLRFARRFPGWQSSPPSQR